MRRVDALVVGGGPAGSSCARVLRNAGWNVLVLDRARFPRDKVCAGWVTPGVFAALDLTPAEYRATGLTFQEIRAFRTGVLGGPLLETRYPAPISYAIRRCEFDDFLLRRAGASIQDGSALASLRRRNGAWLANDGIETPVVIGAGGHFCPVARHLSAGAPEPRPVVAKEAEFRMAPREADRLAEAPELFFCRDLEGYGWCVRKESYLNVGIGRRENAGFATHLREFIQYLETARGITAGEARWRGHAYLASGAGGRPLAADGMLLVGDAAGLAYSESGEGIRPAVESGRIAAESLIGAAGRWDREALGPYEAAIRTRYPSAPRTPPSLRPATAFAGRMLLRSRTFTRHILLDRWFLRTAAHS